MRYAHTQRGRFTWILLGIGVVELSVAFVVKPAGPQLLLGASGLLFLFLSQCFANLTVRDDGERMLIAFGPLRFVRRGIRYDDVVSFRRARSRIIDGWGIHWSPTHGWIWNIDGRDCVEVLLRGGRFRVGTDDPGGLVKHLSERAPHARAE